MPACPFCGHQNPDTVLICKLCRRSLRRHKNRWIRWGILLGLTILLIATVFSIEYFSHQAEMLKIAERNKTALELLSSYGYRTRSSFMVVEGKLRNISGQKLQGVYAVVAWYDSDNQLLAKERAGLRVDPIFNYQSSLFVVKLPYKPGMERYDVSFETEDGAVLLVADTRDKQEDLTFSDKGQ